MTYTEMKAEWKAANKYYKENKEFIDTIHENKKLDFIFLCEGSPSSTNTRKIHKSKTHNKRQSSEYRIGIVNGKMAFIRTSNHWGAFFSQNELHTWELIGAAKKADNTYKSTSQTGYILIDEIKNQGV